MEFKKFRRTDPTKWRETSIFLIKLHCTARCGALSIKIDRATCVTIAARAIPT